MVPKSTSFEFVQTLTVDQKPNQKLTFLHITYNNLLRLDNLRVSFFLSKFNKSYWNMYICVTFKSWEHIKITNIFQYYKTKNMLKFGKVNAVSFKSSLYSVLPNNTYCIYKTHYLPYITTCTVSIFCLLLLWHHSHFFQWKEIARKSWIILHIMKLSWHVKFKDFICNSSISTWNY